jgi:hypothetical protein
MCCLQQVHELEAQLEAVRQSAGSQQRQAQQQEAQNGALRAALQQQQARIEGLRLQLQREQALQTAVLVEIGRLRTLAGLPPAEQPQQQQQQQQRVDAAQARRVSPSGAPAAGLGYAQALPLAAMPLHPGALQQPAGLMPQSPSGSVDIHSPYGGGGGPGSDLAAMLGLQEGASMEVQV